VGVGVGVGSLRVRSLEGSTCSRVARVIQRGVEAGEGGTFTDSVPALVAGGVHDRGRVRWSRVPAAQAGRQGTERAIGTRPRQCTRDLRGEAPCGRRDRGRLRGPSCVMGRCFPMTGSLLLPELAAVLAASRASAAPKNNPSAGAHAPARRRKRLLRTPGTARRNQPAWPPPRLPPRCCSR